MKFIHSLYLAAALSVASVGSLMAQSASGQFTHTVTKGQSLYSISAMYNVSIDDIIRLNPGSEKSIRAGQVLNIPQNGNGGQVKFHTIQAGETLYKLTAKYGVSAERICRANPGLSAKNFRIGQVIAIPSTASQEATQALAETQPEVVPAPQVTVQQSEGQGLQPKCRDMHKVKKKETVYSISRKYGITEEELIAANPEIKGQKLKKGKFLCIPYPKKGSSSKVTQTPAETTIPTDTELFDKNKKESRKYASIKAAIVLPFNTDGTGSNDEQVRMVEYYEGFLMALDSLKQKGVSVDLYTYDSGKTTASINKILNKPEMKNMDVIFGDV